MSIVETNNELYVLVELGDIHCNMTVDLGHNSPKMKIGCQILDNGQNFTMLDSKCLYL